MKRCTCCNVEKDLGEFGKSSRQPDGLHLYCKVCTNEKSRKWRQENLEKSRERGRRNAAARRARNPRAQRSSQLRALYGIDLDEYETMLARQGGRCAICHRKNPGKRRLSVDHDHSTGAVRGLLCGGCNGALGLMDEDPDLLREAIRYIDRHAASPDACSEYLAGIFADAGWRAVQ